MMAFLKRALSSRVDPVTHTDVSPADRDHAKEREVKDALRDLAQSVVSYERKSWQVRQELAGNALKIVSGE